jgi:hypothetical protein
MTALRRLTPQILQGMRAVINYQKAHRTVSNRLYKRMVQEIGENASVEARLTFFSQFSRLRLFLEGIVGYGQQMLNLFVAPSQFIKWLTPTPAGAVGFVIASGVAGWLLWRYRENLKEFFEDLRQPEETNG